MRKVAVFLPSLAGGGAERSMLNVARGFSDVASVDLVLARAEGPLRASVAPGVRIVDLGARRTFGAVVPLARYLRSVRPDGMIAAVSHANLVAVMAATLAGVGTPVVVSEQSQLSTGLEHAQRRRDRFTPMLMRRLFPRATAVTAVSRGVADDLVARTGLEPAAVTVANNPVMAEDLEHQAKQPLEHPWLACGHGPVVVAAGRLTEQKDFPCLLRALTLVRQHDVRAVILGDGEDREALQALVSELGLDDSVELTGHVNNPYPFMAAATVFVLSSRWEGLPTVLLEALALGVPIVSTDCPSGPREILEDGHLGRLVPVGDPAALADAIAESIECGTRPSPGVAEQYRLDNVVQRYADLLGIR
jgi:glycosyltransferase involved in cell wall biosynthesis